jgi:hypothetical protein
LELIGIIGINFAKIVDFFNWFDVIPGSNDVYQRNRMTQRPLKERGNSTIVLNAMLLTIRRQGQTELDAVCVTGDKKIISLLITS